MTGAEHDAIVSAPAAVRGPTVVRNNFDGLRLIAALLVVYGHQAIDHSGTQGLRLLMFFSISGFLVAGSWSSDPHVARFLARRFLRIWPAYAVLIVCCAALSWIFPAPDMPEVSRMASRFYLGNLVSPGFDWGFFPSHSRRMNSSLWMLSFEIDLYIAFVLIAWCGRRARIAAAVVLLAIATQAEAPTNAPGGLLECWSFYFGGFFAFGVLLRDWPPLRRDAVVAVCVVCGVAAWCGGAPSIGYLLLIPSAAIWIGQRSWPGLRSAARFGDLSLGVFLWAFPVQQVTRLWLSPQLPTMVQLIVVLLQVLPIAWLSCRLIETPALRLKPRRAAGPRAPRVTRASAPVFAPPAERAFRARWIRWSR